MFASYFSKVFTPNDKLQEIDITYIENVMKQAFKLDLHMQKTCFVSPRKKL